MSKRRGDSVVSGEAGRQPCGPGGPVTGAGAFTLIELLVVIGLIALLIGILLPALSSAKDTARRVVCASNQRQLVGGLHAYASDFDGRLPTYVSPLSPEAVNLVSSPRLTYRVAVGPPDGGPRDVEPVNHGHLHTQDYIEAGGVFYCPSQPSPTWQQNTFPAPWLSEGVRGEEDGEKVGDGVYVVRSAYMYNPYVEVARLEQFRRYDNMAQFPDEAAMFMDLLIGSSDYRTIAHDRASTWNVAFGDGHVAPKVDQEVAKKHKQYGSMPWNTFRVFRDLLLEN